MSDVPIRPQALGAVMGAIAGHCFPGGQSIGISGPHSAEVAEAAIQAFLAAEEITLHERGETFPETQLCGPWRRSDV